MTLVKLANAKACKCADSRFSGKHLPSSSKEGSISCDANAAILAMPPKSNFCVALDNIAHIICAQGKDSLA